MKIEDEIRQERFNQYQHKAGVNPIFTANRLLNEIANRLKSIGLSFRRLNVLSILNGQPNHAANVNLIRERLFRRMSNVSRLLNKPMDKGLVKNGS